MIMKRSSLLALASAVALLTACQDTPTTPTAQIGKALLSAGGDGATEYWEPIDLEGWDLCGYDVVDFSGMGHVVRKGSWQDEAGGWHSRYHETWKLTGVGRTTGEIWKWNEHFDWSSNWAPELPGQDEATLLWHVNLVGENQTPNFKIHLTNHYTVNANGDLVSRKFTFNQCE